MNARFSRINFKTLSFKDSTEISERKKSFIFKYSQIGPRIALNY